MITFDIPAYVAVFYLWILIGLSLRLLSTQIKLFNVETLACVREGDGMTFSFFNWLVLPLLCVFMLILNDLLVDPLKKDALNFSPILLKITRFRLII